MSASPHRNDDLAKLRSDLAAMAVEVGFIRVERVLSRRFSADQPREPAGQPGGGHWARPAAGTGPVRRRALGVGLVRRR